jgi:copper chaperone CopZ
MTCEGCARAVRSQIAAVGGVSAVDVRFEQRRAYVVCDPALPDTALIAAVERPGPAFQASVVAR